jgi:ferredoxin
MYAIVVDQEKCDACLLCEKHLPGFIRESKGVGCMPRETAENFECWDSLYAAFFHCPKRAISIRRVR